MIAAVFEDGDTPLVRQGMATTEWNLLSIAADAAAKAAQQLLDEQRREIANEISEPSGWQLDDPRMHYVDVQIDKDFYCKLKNP
jgi:hypothetical protein